MKEGTLGFLWRIMKGSRKYFIAVLICMLISVCFSYISPALVGTIVDSVIGTKPFDLPPFLLRAIEGIGGRDFLFANLYICAIVYLVFVGISSYFNGLRFYYGAKMSEEIAITMRKSMHTHILKLPYQWHMENQTGDTMQRCSSDVETVRNFVADQLTNLVRIITMIVVAFVLMFLLNWRLTLIVFTLVPINFFISLHFFRKNRQAFRKTDEAEAEMSSSVQESFAGVRVVKAFGRERYTRDKFQELNNKYSDMWIKLGKILAQHWAIGDAMRALQVALVVIFGVVFVVGGWMTSGAFVTFMMYNRNLSQPVRMLARIVADMGKAGVSIDRIREIIDLPEETVQAGEGQYPVQGDIVFDNVCFGYDEGDVLKNLSFTVKEGETFAILGGTGSGKSTITYLLGRLYDATTGTVTIGGRNIISFEKDYLRKHMGIVLQEPFLFSKTILENLRITDPTIAEERLFEATETAAVHSSILNFPDGYDTLLGERGVTLSGGQKQRVAIARTLASNPPVLIFDDSLSAVDTETDSKIRASLKARKDKATTIIISHRATTLMEADRIMVLSGGMVSQIGTHAELLAQEGIYRKIWNIQSELENELQTA